MVKKSRRRFLHRLGLSVFPSLFSPGKLFAQGSGIAFWQNGPGVSTDRTLWTWGSATTGAPGHGNGTSLSSPVQVGSAVDWEKVAAGDSHTAAIKSGELWTWGFNNVGQLGQGNQTSTSAPLQVGSDTDWIDVACGDNFTVALRAGGTLWSFGSGGNGRLGTGSTAALSSPTQVGALTDWTDIRCGAAHVLAIKTNGSLWAWGRNIYGEIGNSEPTLQNLSSPVQIGALTNWQSIDASKDFSGAIKSDGTLWMWGRNHIGQLGQNNSSPAIHSSPIQVGALTDWSQISTGVSHSLAIKTDGSLWAWGSNLNGRLGDNTTTVRSSPVQIGSLTDWKQVTAGTSYSGGVRNNGALMTWGYGNFGRLGDGATSDKSSPVQLGALTTWDFVESKESHTVTLQK